MMSRQPNILWIVSDHQVHASRPAGFDRFPLQQRLAQLGVAFTRASSVLPICSPARASMLTGLYPHAHGLTENDGRFGGRTGLDPSDWMLQQPLQEAGYRCGWFGKWHLDNHRSALDYGFEGFSLPGYGYPYGNQTYRDYLERKGLDHPVARMELRNESGTAPGTDFSLIDEPGWFDCESGVARLQGPVEAHEAWFLADLAGDWLDGSHEKPFFLRVDTWGPHPPYLLVEPFTGMLDQDDISLPGNFYHNLENRPEHHRDYRDYWQAALHFDEAEWRLMYQRALEHVILVETALLSLLDRIDLDNTLVVFNSDHGDAVGSNGAVANKGSLMSEATLRIPMLMAGAGLPAGVTCNHLVSNLDLAPTLLDCCAIDIDHELHDAFM